MTGLPWDMKDKVVVISGGNAGIGLGFARGIVKAGGNVVIWGRRGDANDKAAAELAQYGTTVLTQEVDVSDEARVIEAFGEAVERMGRVDGAIANAGLMMNQGCFTNMTSEAWHGLLAVNQHGAFYLAREAARHMRARAEAGDPGGSILFCASLSAVTGSIGMQHYNASKGAMAALARGISVDMGKFGVRANTVCPGYTESETVKDHGPDSPLGAQVRARCPLGRFGTPEDFEGIGVYFMSDASRYHSGDLVLMDGGWMANAGKLDVSAERRA